MTPEEQDSLLALRAELVDLDEDFRHHNWRREYDDREELGLVPIDGCPFIYIVRAVGTEFVKIGFTGGPNPDARLDTLQTGCPHELRMEAWFVGNQAGEAKIHEILAERRVRGEWFRLSETDVLHIESMGWNSWLPIICRRCKNLWSTAFQHDDICYGCLYEEQKVKHQEAAEQKAEA